MANYILAFRGQKDRASTAEDEAAWAQWFQQIATSITDSGNRVGQTRIVGTGPGSDVLSGYIVVNADSLEAAATLAHGCPGVRQGGGVEIGEVIPSS
jgi:uncharacterized protein YciI